jgi:o-succinylbenzoate synthase
VIRLTRLLEHRRVFAEPMASAAGRWAERRSLLIVVEDEHGNFGLGEAAPLPGFSSDTLDEARAALRALRGSVPVGRDFQAPPSVRSAIEGARLDILARAIGKPAWAVQQAADWTSLVRPPAALPLSLWLPEAPDRALATAEAALARGVRCFKVKLIPGSDAGVALLRELRGKYGSGVALRADANASFTCATLERFLPALRELELEWLEEPTAEPLAGALGVPLALDESLGARGPGSFAADRALGITALVLKPTTLGGLCRSIDLSHAATADSLACVASHTLEGPVGFMTAATLALRLGPRFAHGLGPHPGLGGFRPPALHPVRDELVAWDAPGLGLTLEMGLVRADVLAEERF